MSESGSCRRDSVIRIALFFSGILVFAWFCPKQYPWYLLSIAGVILAAIAPANEIRSFGAIPPLFGLRKPGWKESRLLIISVATGMIWGIIFRVHSGLHPFPERLVFFAFTASLTGATEEIIFRGYFQEKLRQFSVPGSVAGASVAHAIYKFTIFFSIHDAGYPVDYLSLFIWTTVVGIILGTLKELSGNSWIPAGGHAAFDVISYGDGLIHAWWIWT